MLLPPGKAPRHRRLFPARTPQAAQPPSFWPEAGKPFVDTPHSPALAVAWGLACTSSPARRAHTGPQRSSCGSRAEPSLLLFTFLPSPLPPRPTKWQPAPKPWSEADSSRWPTQSQGQRAPFLKPSMPAQSPALSPKEGHSLCLSQYSLSTSQPLSLRPAGSCRLRETEHLPTILIYLWGRATTRRSFGTTANGTLVNVMETGD